MAKTKTYPVKAIKENPNDGKFFDSYGHEVKHGTKIIIEDHYNYQHFENRLAMVEWDQEKGMYKYRFIDGEKVSLLYNFYGVHKFKVNE